MKTFEVTSGALAVSDPCYTPDVWCMGYLEGVKNGIWHTDVLYLSNEQTCGWGERIAELRIFHVSLNEFPDEDMVDGWTVADITVGVDSGQAGFFDKEFFDVTPRGEYIDEESFYGKACTLTHSDDAEAKFRMGLALEEGEHYYTHGILFDRGVVSSSGLGDGSYECLFLRIDGEIVAAKIVFLTEEDFEDEEEAA